MEIGNYLNILFAHKQGIFKTTAMPWRAFTHQAGGGPSKRGHMPTSRRVLYKALVKLSKIRAKYADFDDGTLQ